MTYTEEVYTHCLSLVRMCIFILGTSYLINHITYVHISFAYCSLARKVSIHIFLLVFEASLFSLCMSRPLSCLAHSFSTNHNDSRNLLSRTRNMWNSSSSFKPLTHNKASLKRVPLAPHLLPPLRPAVLLQAALPLFPLPLLALLAPLPACKSQSSHHSPF